MDLRLLILLFPAVFMFHDFEEIIFFKVWLRRNKALLNQRFPKLAVRVVPHLERLSTASFALAVAEEFVVLSIVTYACAWLDRYALWYAIFMAFFLHLVGHLGQWLVLRRYTPSIVTSILALPYCVYTFIRFADAGILDRTQLVVWTFIGLALMILNLLVAHTLALRFERWQAAGQQRYQQTSRSIGKEEKRVS